MEKIVSTARLRGDEALKEAEAGRKAALAEGLARLDAESADRLAMEKKRILEADAQEISALRLAERNRLRIRKRALLDSVAEAAWKKALEPVVFKRWLEKKIAAVCAKGDSLITSAAQAESFSGAFAEILKRQGVTLSAEKGSFKAGFIVERGSVRINCTLDQELKAAVREKETELSRVLFGQPS
jgi:vacuolar-type H+-ATPase subunit E/Vma4